MLAHKKCSKRRHSGMVYAMALLLLMLFGSVAAAFVATTDLNLQKSINHEKGQAAMFAAESGLEFAMMHLENIVSEGVWEGTPDMIGLTAAAFGNTMNGTGNLGQSTVAYNADTGVVTTPWITLPHNARFALTVTRLDADTLRLSATGETEGAARSIAIDYSVNEDSSVMSYAVASRPRVIARGNIQIDGDLCSTWTRTDKAPALDIELGDDGYVSEGVKTVLSEEEFNDDDGLEHVDEDLHDQMVYSEPELASYTTDDFDTGEILDWMASTGNKNNLPSTSKTQWEKFPAKSTGTWFERPVYENQTFDYTFVSENTHARFKNCTFTGITYIDSDGTSKSTGNNIVFEDCTFEGPVVTDVPSSFQWKYNSMNFEGDTVFKSSEIAGYLDGCTILAPNFNVNIGDFHKQGDSSDSKLTGILVGGIVDIRDNAVIEGTILSMADLDHISSPYAYGTNLGYWEEDAEEYGGTVPMTTNIKITPTPDGTLPMGIKKRYTLSPNSGSYVEVAVACACSIADTSDPADEGGGDSSGSGGGIDIDLPDEGGSDSGGDDSGGSDGGQADSGGDSDSSDSDSGSGFWQRRRWRRWW